MIEFKEYTLTISGERFSPKNMEMKCGIKFDKKNEKGEIGKIGRYKNEVIPFGYGRKDTNEEKLGVVIDSIEEYIKNKELSGIEDINILLNIEWSSQCNFEINNKIIEKIIKLNVPLSITCFEKDN